MLHIGDQYNTKSSFVYNKLRFDLELDITKLYFHLGLPLATKHSTRIKGQINKWKYVRTLDKYSEPMARTQFSVNWIVTGHNLMTSSGSYGVRVILHSKHYTNIRDKTRDETLTCNIKAFSCQMWHTHDWCADIAPRYSHWMCSLICVHLRI